jgi:CDP-paratose 2-epimerase
MRALVTGCSGLIGSEAALYFDGLGYRITGLDNNLRQFFFGPSGDTRWNLARVERQAKNFEHVNLDIRDREGLAKLFKKSSFDAVIHCAAQPSHDKARDIPLIDFDVNAMGTINLLEMTRLYSPGAVFIHVSTNKVYGDAPNKLDLVELETRYDYADEKYRDGIAEDFSIDQSLHSLFGASKLAGDIVAQEYGRYFGMKVGVFRGGCLTGPSHSGVELHGFLSYLVKVAVSGGKYTVFGYKGKQVRDQIHSYDVIRAFESFINSPRPGEVYNIGGGRSNSGSVIECINLIEKLTGRSVTWSYEDKNRIGDHICYISNLTKLKTHFPGWSVTRNLTDICEEIIEAIDAQL